MAITFELPSDVERQLRRDHADLNVDAKKAGPAGHAALRIAKIESKPNAAARKLSLGCIAARRIVAR